MPDKKALGNSNIYLFTINLKLKEIKLKRIKKSRAPAIKFYQGTPN